VSITIGDAILYLRSNNEQLDAGLKKAHTDTESMFRQNRRWSAVRLPSARLALWRAWSA